MTERVGGDANFNVITRAAGKAEKKENNKNIITRKKKNKHEERACHVIACGVYKLHCYRLSSCRVVIRFSR